MDDCGKGLVFPGFGDASNSQHRLRVLEIQDRDSRGMFTPKEIMVISIVIISTGIIGGTALIIATGLPLLWIGLGGLACLLVYPFMKYHAAGDLAIFLAFGILPAFGTDPTCSGLQFP